MKVCRNLTDMSVFELAALPGLRRLSLVRVQKLTDIGLHSLAEHASELERLHLSYCDRLSLDAMHLLLRKLQRLEYFAATGVPCMRRKGVQRFSETTPKVSEGEISAINELKAASDSGRLEPRTMRKINRQHSVCSVERV